MRLEGRLRQGRPGTSGQDGTAQRLLRSGGRSAAAVAAATSALCSVRLGDGVRQGRCAARAASRKVSDPSHRIQQTLAARDAAAASGSSVSFSSRPAIQRALPANWFALTELPACTQRSCGGDQARARATHTHTLDTRNQFLGSTTVNCDRVNHLQRLLLSSLPLFVC